jgi:6-phosphogluconolactonase (cycloisomerase 2 family)
VVAARPPSSFSERWSGDVAAAICNSNDGLYVNSTTHRRESHATLRALVLGLCTGIFVVACNGTDVTETSPNPNTGGVVSVGGVTEYQVYATLNGLQSGESLGVKVNGGTTLSLTSNSRFALLPLPYGASYAVTIASQPTGQVCTVANGSGTIDLAPVSNLSISCTGAYYAIAAGLVGLFGSQAVELSVNGGAAKSLTGTGVYTLTSLHNGSSYSVTIAAQPSGGTCYISRGSGTIQSAAVTVDVACLPIDYSIYAEVSGLAGSGLVLQVNGGNNLSVTASGAHPFHYGYEVYDPYAVTVLTQPSNPAQVCSVSNGSGTISGNVTVSVTCVALDTISASVTGLSGSGLVLQNNGGNDLGVSGNGTSTFTTGISSGGSYDVTVQSQPSAPAQRCTVVGGSGTASANVTVAVTCRNVGKYLFVANPFDSNSNNGEGSVAAFAITPSTGALTAVAGSPFAPPWQEDAPYALALDPGGGFLYVTDISSADISTWGIGSGGVLTPDAALGSPVSIIATIPLPLSMAIDPAGPYLYVGGDANPNGGVDVYTLANGALTLQAGSPHISGNDPLTLAVDPADKFLYAPDLFDGSIAQFSIASGALSSPSYDNTLSSPYAVAVHPTGLFVYVTDNGNNSGSTANTIEQYSYSASTGALTPLASYSVGHTPEAIAIDPTGSFLYVSNTGDGTVSAFSINPGTGALTSIHAVYTASGASSSDRTALAIDPSGQYL